MIKLMSLRRGRIRFLVQRMLYWHRNIRLLTKLIARFKINEAKIKKFIEDVGAESRKCASYRGGW